MAKRAMMIGLDGADPFIIRKLIDDGRMPNLKKLLDNGAAHTNLAMLGAFPSVTPPNWASLATGNWPRTHGVTCYHNHTLGKNLGLCEVNWDSRRVMSEMIWETFGQEGKRALMVNYCEAWPPRVLNDNNIFIDGTGVVPFMRCNPEYQKLIDLEVGDFKTESKLHVVKSSSSDCVVQGDQFEKMKAGHETEESESLFEPIAESDMVIVPPGDPGKPSDDEADRVHAALQTPENWERELPEDALVAVVPMNNGLVRRYFVVTASDGVNLDTITIYKNRKADGEVLGIVKADEWSGWIYDYFTKDDEQIKVGYQLRWLSTKDNRKISLYMSFGQNMDDLRYIYPQAIGRKLLDEVGPAMCFAKYGQLGIYGDFAAKQKDFSGHEVLLESFQKNLDWHIDVSNWLFKECPDWQLYYIHLHAIDLYNHWYINKTLAGSNEDYEVYREFLYRLYASHDKYIGEMMKQLNGDTVIFVCSDHAAVPHTVGDVNPGLGSIAGITVDVMGQLGYTSYFQDETGKWKIDWSQTKAVFQRSSYIYVNLKGRDPQGIVEPEDYDATINQIITDLYNYKHPVTGKRVVAFCMTRDEMEIVGMGGPHCGDILCQLVPTYCEEHANCPTTATNEGYSLNNLCIMGGAGIKKGVLLNRVIRVTDVVPTICYLTGTAMPSNCEGGVIYQALEGFNEKVYE